MTRRDLSELAARQARQRGPGLPMEATVASPPESPTSFLRVVVDTQPGRVRECAWTPRSDIEPTTGDAALVIESDAGDLWVIAWWPNTLEGS